MPNLASRFRPRVFALDRALPVPDLLDLLRDRRGLVALDSAAGEPRNFSLVAFDPLRGGAVPRAIGDVRALVACLDPRPGDPVPGPFAGGFLGAFSYDLGVAGEARTAGASDPWRSPLVVGGLYTDFVVRDERDGRAWLVLGEGALDGRASVADRRAHVWSDLARARSRASEPVPLGPLVRHTSPTEHQARIERARARIAAGEFYQANLAHRFTRRTSGHPVDLYRRLRAVNPAPYMAFLNWDEDLAAEAAHFPRGAILSASPELLLEFDGSVARTRPIKGTARRSSDPLEDARLARGLLESAKDQAELAMIVDLERNDLGRLARPGAVSVEHFPRLESHAAVHHLSADVVAVVREGVDAVAVLEALFPGGSISGAPKVASMRAIAELEGQGRGFFTGSLGFVDVSGRACFDILIRTLVWRPLAGGAGEVAFHVGGGITWSSDAASEERETLVKAERLAAALEAQVRST